MIPPRANWQQPVIESDRGQYLIAANWIQHLAPRECLMSLYLTEQEKETNVRHIVRAKDVSTDGLTEPLEAIKERLLRVRAVPIRDTLEVVLKRNLLKKKPPKFG